MKDKIFNNRFISGITEQGRAFLFDGIDLEVYDITPSKRDSTQIMEEIINSKKNSTYEYDESIPIRVPNDYFQREDINVISINLHDGCNLACRYCYISASKKTNERLTARVFVDILEYFKDLREKHLIFYFAGGGEPTLNFELLKTIPDLCKEKGFLDCEFEITTNGTLLSNKSLEFYKENKFTLDISLDGDKINDASRIFPNGKSSFDIVINNINKCKELGIAFSCKAVIQPMNIGILNAFVFFEENEIPFTFSFATESLDHSFVTNENQTSGFRSQMESICHFYREKIIRNEKIYCSKIIGDLLHIHYRMITNIACMASKNGFYIDLDGSIYPCSYFIKSKKIGSIYSEIDYESIISDSLYAKPVEFIPTCNKCWAKYLCSGACFAIRWVNNRNLNEVVPYMCSVNKVYWYEIIRLYASVSTIIKEGNNVNFV